MIPTVYDPQHFKHKWFINKYREYNQPAIDYARENKEVPRFLLDWLDDRITREDYLYLVSLMAPGFYTQDEICGARQSLTVEAPITQPTYSQHVRQYHRITVDPSAYNLSEEPKH